MLSTSPPLLQRPKNIFRYCQIKNGSKGRKREAAFSGFRNTSKQKKELVRVVKNQIITVELKISVLTKTLRTKKNIFLVPYQSKVKFGADYV